MRVACLQFDPQVGDVANNFTKADAILTKAKPENLDLLVLPEMAFSGYNFSSLEHITPYLEPTTSGVTSSWARTTALKYNCIVTVGYPEKVSNPSSRSANPECYNSTVTVDKEGKTIANYRKSFLYYTDETWAHEGSGFYDGDIRGLGTVAMGICMDLNPYKFETPWITCEFACHVLQKKANLVILSMAWLTRQDQLPYGLLSSEPDMDTISYWIMRLKPIIEASSNEEIIIILANRCGTEGEATYAGTSTVLGIKDGEVNVYGILGRGDGKLLIVDTDARPMAKIISNA
ncbi:putative carbon-nitrogen hydrolase protein [Botrytis fragariae]|uniref:Putative carbon-nitrogen hydrolase protein n=1 Tax=Botrytis fragariae TaxID=1964551 RepID=A0A8H6AYI1_9HELO|nr:putative carbon-nitrogen hydrolase protein [Botrytis fragariae]KAF5875810.1 putative carbon-nitrogen hydrolase protein [Botrytis fragariae]